ncbi:response regulator [Crossiella sp. CA198]|uniref:response regulator n=1 Tax=Crossiella sp. CA198 TaxID=3455607 RepID=UPI003F8D13D4
MGIVDETLARYGIRGILESAPDLRVVGEAGDGAAAVRLARQQRPRVLLMDLWMPGQDGLSAIEAVREQAPETAVVVLTAFEQTAVEQTGHARRAVGTGTGTGTCAGMGTCTGTGTCVGTGTGTDGLVHQGTCAGVGEFARQARCAGTGTGTGGGAGTGASTGGSWHQTACAGGGRAVRHTACACAGGSSQQATCAVAGGASQRATCAVAGGFAQQTAGVGMAAFVHRAMRAGVAGFVVKDAGPAELLNAVRVVAGGEAILSPRLTRLVLAHFTSVDPRRFAQAHRLLGQLSAREREVLALVARGASNVAIGAALRVSESTIKSHLSRVMAKIGCANRVQAAMIARDGGLVS